MPFRDRKTAFFGQQLEIVELHRGANVVPALLDGNAAEQQYRTAHHGAAEQQPPYNGAIFYHDAPP